MAFEQNDMSGALFKNDKEGNEKRPDYTGTCKIDGVEMRMSAWLKTDRNGNTYMSLAFTPPSDQYREKAQPVREEPAHDPLDDEVPF